MKYQSDVSLNDIEKRIARIKDGAWFLTWVLKYLPNVPRTFQFDETIQFLLVYARYTNRMNYHAEQFVNHLKVILNALSRTPEVGQEVFISTGDSLFFDFDAFIVSAKSLVEENIRNRAKHLNRRLHKTFEHFSQLNFIDFINPFLSPLRNEILHVGKFGSSLQSQLSLRNDGQSVHVSMRPVFGHLNDPSVDLISVFNEAFEQMENIFCHVAGCVLAHLFARWGTPLNFAEVFAKKSINIAYFKIPKI